VLTSAVVIGWIVFFLHRAYGIGSDRLPAPQAVLMSMVVKGVLTLSLPWTLVFIGAFLAACVELLGVPSLPFAVGLYLPVRLSTPIMAGGIVRLITERTTNAAVRHGRRERGVLFASGLIAGGGLAGIAAAGLVNAQAQRDMLLAEGQPVGAFTSAVAGFYERIHIGFDWAGSWSGAFSVALFVGLAVVLATNAGLFSRRR